MRKVLAITMGDAAGIGAEIIVKSLADRALYDQCIPVVYGDRAPMEDALRFIGHRKLTLRVITRPEEARGEAGIIELIDHDIVHTGQWHYKENQALTGDASFRYIVHAIRDAMECKVDAVVTAPISKEAIHLAGHNYSGHTEIFADYTHTKKYAMLLSNKDLSVIHVTTHVSMEQACHLITKERVLEVIRLAQEGMLLLGKSHPRIGVAGSTPTAQKTGSSEIRKPWPLSPPFTRRRPKGWTLQVRCRRTRYSARP